MAVMSSFVVLIAFFFYFSCTLKQQEQMFCSVVKDVCLVFTLWFFIKSCSCKDNFLDVFPVFY